MSNEKIAKVFVPLKFLPRDTPIVSAEFRLLSRISIKLRPDNRPLIKIFVLPRVQHF